VLADKDHVFFEYQPKHTSDAACSMFKGFKGYIQADAHCIYDAVFRGDAVDEGDKPPDEVACWSHARRRLWEAAVTLKDPYPLLEAPGFAQGRSLPWLGRCRFRTRNGSSWSQSGDRAASQRPSSRRSTALRRRRCGTGSTGLRRGRRD
jgi:hypothetical protein